MAKNHSYFKYVANGITPDEDTINNFIVFLERFIPYKVNNIIYESC